MDDASDSQPSIYRTTILDVNDFCLRQVFKHLHVMDLCAAADVCTRFRGNIIAHFELSNHRNIEFDEFLDEVDETAEEKILKISKVLRNFGPFLTSIQLNGCFQTRAESRYQRRVCELLSSYCSGGALTDLQLYEFEFPDEIACIVGQYLELCGS